MAINWPWRKRVAHPAMPPTMVPAGVDAARWQQIRDQWLRGGYAVLPGFYGADALDSAEAELRHAWDRRAARIVVDDLSTGQRLHLADVGTRQRAEHRFKVNDLYLECQSIRDLALNERITPILNALLGHVPVLCNSLSFQLGSQQPDHVDALYMTPRTPHHLIAIWVALEDCHPDAGPLRYYPGSHRITPYVFSNGSHHVVDAEMPAWNVYMREHVQRLGLVPATFAARKGDIFIWSAYLLHGGSPIKDPNRTRNSVVFHYYSHPDAQAQGCRLIPAHGGYWMHRMHQPVPGGPAPEAPPL